MTTRVVLPDDVRDRIARLDITAQTLVEGLISGLHRSPYHGFSVEFAQHREYTWGDELKHVDWKVFARTDRYYVKQYEEETNLQAVMVVDSSESMVYRGDKATSSKYEYAATLAAGLAFVLLRQQDAAGLVLFDQEVRRRIPPSAHPAQLRHMTAALSEVEVAGESGAPVVLDRVADELARRGLVFVITDALFPRAALLDGIRHLRHRRHEVVLLHVVDPDEVEFPFEDNTQFVGLEHLPTLLADPRALRDAYLEAFRGFVREVQGGCQDARADYLLIDTRVPVGATLSRYLTQRQRRGGRTR